MNPEDDLYDHDLNIPYDDYDLYQDYEAPYWEEYQEGYPPEDSYGDIDWWYYDE